MAGRKHWPRFGSFFAFLLVLLLCNRIVNAKEEDEDNGKDRVMKRCIDCRKLAVSFEIGLDLTNRKGYGGGDVVWEEKKLGKYENSEMRLLDITEKTCKRKDFQCNTMLENYEDEIEKWFFKLRQDETDFAEWFCEKTLKVCCPFNTFGPDCQACPGNGEFSCSQHGKCHGNGTRSGNGSCICETGYSGSVCENCTTGYVQKGSECNDINECEANACDVSLENCENTEGSFICTCKEGFQKEGDVCVPAEPTEGTESSTDDSAATNAVEEEKAAEVDSHEEL
ncbi:uncharacterized protein TRIADDRAFT_61862 [Trichoplax adhaerens]|uniref:EGF-like domain-containing protein n=1 Tax=Trichoplax adhaerens TaxID=10228 RepID=B3SC70_TRIAD|nr:hypothetical protein TRIADDRAFT_61862 [Trichoplax adhaerens]EDV19668.1 hypothetical protein TRIADDRAFT_61862 [Trichoplax adhaerens]|eukprot:XP_002117825.1 hypothetical protein TRIADDRAFT_61862 [Trichoplax adhaerens]